MHVFFGILSNSGASYGSGGSIYFFLKRDNVYNIFPLFDEDLRIFAVYPSVPWGNGVVFLCPLPPLKTQNILLASSNDFLFWRAAVL